MCLLQAAGKVKSGLYRIVSAASCKAFAKRPGLNQVQWDLKGTRDSGPGELRQDAVKLSMPPTKPLLAAPFEEAHGNTIQEATITLGHRCAGSLPPLRIAEML